MPLDPLTYIAYFESSLGTNTKSPTGSTASGVFQDVNGTWANALKYCDCGTTSQWPTAASAPTSVQFAANSALFNKEGWQPWLCNGCDPPLAAAVQAAGGTSQFTAPGQLNTTPGYWSNAGVDTSSGLAQYFADNGGKTVTSTNPDGSPGTPMPVLGTPGSGVVTVNNVGFTGFSWVWNQWQGGAQSTLSSMAQTIQTNTYGTLGNLIVLDITLVAVLLMFQIRNWDTLWSRMGRAAIVVTLLAANSNYYTNMFLAFFSGFSNTISQWLGLTPIAASAFDLAWNIFDIKANTVMQNIPFPSGTWFSAEIKLTIAGTIQFISLAVAFTVWWLSQALMEVLAILGPLLAIALLFDYTRGIWDAYVRTMLHLALVSITAIILAGISLQLVQNALAGISAQANGTNALGTVSGLSQAAAVTFALCCVITVLPFVLSYICYGAIAGASIFNHAGATALGNAPSSAVSAAPGAAVSAGAGIVRGTAAVGSSLSR